MSCAYDLKVPISLQNALDLLSDAQSMPLAGGTNLLVEIRSGKERPQRLVALDRIEGLAGIDINSETITIGARATVGDLLRSTELAKAAPSLVKAAGVFAGQMVRNAGTIGGNIACASPAADLVPPLMSLDAQVTLQSSSGSRVVALDEYYQGYKQDVRRPDELVTQISMPRLPDQTHNRFYKLARRRGDAITVVGLAVTLTVSDGVCRKARIAMGAVAPCVIRARNAEALLEGNVFDAAMIETAAAQAAAECAPIDDVRASAQYRRHCVRKLTRRLVAEAWNDLEAKVEADV
ncbi:carbon-monoxide dehydrogenase medium subunit [Shimia gijangensis]|uniref:Carbon-monoxide dehydrogenase medium subunit n=1 Tax=Shimia gijangensis TaxID=1470563 RepID=A0A1M6NS92_9RHOB|nr:xanthine dehydrogenase family protein subunit M [Shimia gijangensis]SHJ98452.1 carbon-monoxide dehydrogenase medium subunit [Shimia gijangensis]